MAKRWLRPAIALAALMTGLAGSGLWSARVVAGPPNEADFCGLTFPLTFTVGSGATTPSVAGRIFETGVTESAGGSGSVGAELGYGPEGSDPTTDGGWTYFTAAFSVQFSSEDEYAATFTAPATLLTTDYAYTFRFTLDGGATYTYCDSDGNGSNEGLTFDAELLGLMTVTGSATDWLYLPLVVR